MTKYEIVVGGISASTLADFVRRNLPTEAQLRATIVRRVRRRTCPTCGDALSRLLADYRTAPSPSSALVITMLGSSPTILQYAKGSCECLHLKQEIRSAVCRALIKKLRQAGLTFVYRVT
jgi:hypothetical protein